LAEHSENSQIEAMFWSFALVAIAEAYRSGCSFARNSPETGAKCPVSIVVVYRSGRAP